MLYQLSFMIELQMVNGEHITCILKSNIMFYFTPFENITTIGSWVWHEKRDFGIKMYAGKYSII